MSCDRFGVVMVVVVHPLLTSRWTARTLFFRHSNRSEGSSASFTLAASSSSSALPPSPCLLIASACSFLANGEKYTDTASFPKSVNSRSSLREDSGPWTTQKTEAPGAVRLALPVAWGRGDATRVKAWSKLWCCGVGGGGGLFETEAEVVRSMLGCCC